MRLRGRKTPVKVIDNIPANYSGKLYYRLVENLENVARPRWKTKIPKGEDRWALLVDELVLKDVVRRSGRIVDANGELLPAFEEPLRLVAENDEDLDSHFNPRGLVSEWAYEQTKALDPVGHVWIPVDVERPNGSSLRVWKHLFDTNYLTSPPFLVDPKANELEPFTYNNGEQGYDKPEWACQGSANTTFGYLREDTIAGRHLFSSGMVDNAPVISAELCEKLSSEVNAFARSVELHPVGSI